VANYRLLPLSGKFKINEIMKANYQILGLAFFAFYQDTLNLFAPELWRIEIKIPPTNHKK
jgi:hypothetical protein